MGEGRQPAKQPGPLAEVTLKTATVKGNSSELRRGKPGQKPPGWGYRYRGVALHEDRPARHEGLNMHRITARAGEDSLIEMSPTNSFNGE